MVKNSFSFNGRIGCKEYGISVVIFVLVGTISRMLIIKVMDPQTVSEIQNAKIMSWLLVNIPLLWFIWAQGAKRCHDYGESGWLQLIPLYPIYMLFKKGDKEAN